MLEMVCVRWGQVTKIEAPAGYTNVRAHALFHREFLRKQQTAAQARPPVL